MGWRLRCREARQKCAMSHDTNSNWRGTCLIRNRLAYFGSENCRYEFAILLLQTGDNPIN